MMERFDLISYLEKLNKEKDINSAFEALGQACSYIGMDRVVYSLLSPHESIGYVAGHAIVGNYPDDWMDYYTHKSYVKLDPVIKLMKKEEGSFFWSELEEKKQVLSPREKKLMDEAQEAGLHNGVGLSIKSPYGEIVGMGFASSHKINKRPRESLAFLAIVAKQFDLTFKQLAIEKKKINFKYELTIRQKDILCWIAKDKKYNEIADILNISENTVLYHTKEIFKRLEVNSVMAAVLKSIKLGLITP